MSEREHKRWNVQGQVTAMEYLRNHVMAGGADSLNWLLCYSFTASTEDGEHELSPGWIGKEYGKHGIVTGHFEGYALMPRVGGCSKVELTVETNEDALFISQCVATTMLTLIGDAGPAISDIPWMGTRSAMQNLGTR